MMEHKHARKRRAGVAAAVLVTIAAGVGLGTSAPAGADGNTFQWKKNGNKAKVYWRSFKDDAAYMTVTSTGQQLSGNRKMYVRVQFYALRCAAGMNTCYSIGAGGTYTESEGAEWHQIGEKRQPSMPPPGKRQKIRQSASQALDEDSQLMQARISLCYNRNITPDPCSKPRYGTLAYNKG